MKLRDSLATIFLLTLFALVPSLVGVAGADADEDPWKTTARYAFEYRVPLNEVASDGTKIRLWVPWPAEHQDQKILESKVEAPWKWKLHREETYGNRMIYTEGTVTENTPDLVMRFEIERHPYSGVRPVDGKPLAGNLDPSLYKGPNRLVPLSGVIEKIAEKESEGLSNDHEKIQAFYDYVYRTMRYNKAGKGWGRGDAVWACTHKRGNCTDFHSLFIGMLRSQGIPARFLIGFPIPTDRNEAEIGGYHCWAEFYDEERGWIPVDASEAKKSGRKQAYFGTLPNDRIEFTVGRDVRLSPPQEGGPANYFIYPYVEVDGKPLEEVPATFRFRRLPSRVSS